MRYKGQIISYVENKGYGFIKDENGKKVFFHKKDIKTKNNIIIDGMILEYDLLPTDKGYSAKKINIKSNEKIKYITPESIYTSKLQDIKGWETLQRSGWRIGTSTRNNLDDAIEELKEIAELTGANALLEMTYSKTTESESSDNGYGTHYYTMHYYWAEPAIIGKKSIKGNLLKNKIPNLDNIFYKIYEDNNQKNSKAFKKKIIWWILILTIALFLLKYQWPETFSPLSIVERDNKEWWWFPTILTIGIGMFIQNIMSHGDYNNWLKRK